VALIVHTTKNISPLQLHGSIRAAAQHHCRHLLQIYHQEVSCHTGHRVVNPECYLLVGCKKKSDYIYTAISVFAS